MHQVKATISSGYRWRLVLISLLMLGFGVYCLYDWQVTYPRTKEIGLTYQALKESNPENYPELWPSVAAESGWPTEPPLKIKNEKQYDTDIFTQLLMALITLPIGFYFLGKLILESRRWVAMDEQGLTASGGRRIPWSHIQSVDDTRWKTKGILWVHYVDEQGRAGKVLLDDFKAEREPVKRIVEAVQAHLYPQSDSEVADPAGGEVLGAEDAAVLEDGAALDPRA